MAVLGKSQQIEKYIRGQISRGHWEAGDRLPSEHEIGKRLGVSYATVNNTISRLAADGLLERIQRKGTFVAASPTKATVVILGKGELLASPTGYYLHRGVEEVRRVIHDSGYRPILEIGRGRTKKDLVDSIRFLDKPIVKDTVGVLSLFPVPELEGEISRAGLPVVYTAPGVSCGGYAVVLDYKNMVETAVGQLRDRGYDDFVLIYPQGPPDMRSTEYEDCMSRVRLDAIDHDPNRLVEVPWSLNRENAYETMKTLLSRPKRPRAVFFEEDGVCEWACRAISDAGMRLPDDLAVITHANTGRQLPGPVPLARLEFDPAEAVRLAWTMLDDLVQGKMPESNTVFLKPTWIEGASLGYRT